MARKLRLQYPGARYHVMNRGDHREPIFQDDHDRQVFLETLSQSCARTGWQIQAFCLMPNHFHLVMETPRANLAVGMQWLLSAYTSRFNRRHKLSGHLFSGRYKCLIVDGSANGYLKTVCDYVHLNPARAKLLKPEQPLEHFRWSSYPEYLKAQSRRPDWLRVGRLLGEHGIPKDSPAGRREFARRMEARRQAETGEDFRLVRRSWYLGDKAFRKELLEQMHERMGANHYGEERFESEEERARRILREELNQRGWDERELEARRKGDSDKVQIALRLRRDTAMTFAWIARRLRMGAAGSLANALRAAS
jgi:REP element-mobilizing transposase RayT